MHLPLEPRKQCQSTTRAAAQDRRKRAPIPKAVWPNSGPPNSAKFSATKPRTNPLQPHDWRRASSSTATPTRSPARTPLPAPRARHCTAGAAAPRRWHGGKGGQVPTAGTRVVTGAHLPRPRGGGARSRRPPGRRRTPPRPRLPRRRRPLQLPPPPSGPPRHQIRGRRDARGEEEWSGGEATRGEEPSQAAGVRPSPARTASRFCSAPTCTSPVSHPRARS